VKVKSDSMTEGTLDDYNLPVHEVLQGEKIMVSLFISL